MALSAAHRAREVDRDELEALTRSHLPLVYRSVARVIGRIPRRPGDDDLVAAAMMGLVQAAVAYDPSRNVAFAGFAAVRVRGAVLDELRRSDWASRPVRANAKKMDAAAERLTAALGRVPTESELADELGMAVPDLQRLVGDIHRALVLSTAEADDNDIAGGDDPLDRVIDLEARATLRAAISCLPTRHHRVVVGYYFESMTMRELGEELGVTESRICQLSAEAIDLLRGAVTAGSTAGPSVASLSLARRSARRG